MAIIDKIRLSGQTYDIIDATAVHSLDGYATTGYVQSATSALAESFEEVISGKADSSAVTLEISAAVSGKADTSAVTEAIDAAVSGKADASDVETLSGTVTGHTADTTIHVTSSDKEAWNAKADISDIPSVSGYADSVKYNSTSKYVEFYHGGTGGTVVFSYDASPFLIDGMVQNVEIKDVTISGESVTCLVISFNTDAGKQDINIPLTDIFDPSNYYTKSEIDASLSGKVNVSDNQVDAYGTASTTASTEGISYVFSADSYANAAFEFYSQDGYSDENNKVNGRIVIIDSSDNVVEDYTLPSNQQTTTWNPGSQYFTVFSKTKDSVAIAPTGDYRIKYCNVSVDAMEPYNLVKYYTTSTKYPSYQSAEAIENNVYPKLDAIESGKTDTSAFTAHTADTTIHVTSSDKETWNGKQNALTPGTGIQISGDVISVTGAPLTMDDHLDSGSTNPVMNSAITVAIDAKQATLVSGTNIKTVGTESILGSGNIKLMTASIGEGNDSTTLIFDFN